MFIYRNVAITIKTRRFFNIYRSVIFKYFIKFEFYGKSRSSFESLQIFARENAIIHFSSVGY